MEKRDNQLVLENTYELLDSGHGNKLERFGRFVLARPCSQAVWTPKLSKEVWNRADALFLREGDVKWTYRNPATKSGWQINVEGIDFNISTTDFGHLGIFPEQRQFWQWIQMALNKVRKTRNGPVNVLNLFAYSGGSTLASAKAGAHVCHLDASKGMVAWARENAKINKLDAAPIRWIVEDVGKFVQREMRRGKRYDAIILDPPSFGRGGSGEIFKIEEHLIELFTYCRSLLSETPLFILFSCHTPGFTPLVMHHLLSQTMEGFSGKIDCGEMLLTGGQGVFPLPSGTYARWLAPTLDHLEQR